MEQPDSKLDRLGDILGVDDTDDLPRPEPRRGVGEVLARGVPSVATQQSEPGSRGLQDSAAESESYRRDGRARRAEPDRPRRSRELASSKVPMHRTTSTVPIGLVERLEVARSQRWVVSRLLSSALDQTPPGVEVVEDLLDRYDRSPRAVCSYRLPVGQFEELDALADEWRVSRSQVVGVLLHLELARQGL